MNNNRDWFLDHKQQYVQKLYEPMKALGRELFVPFMERPGNVLKVSRIYRDARLHHPDPYKESLWICIRRDVEWWAENPCLFFEIRPDGVSYGFFYWRPRTQVLEAIRQDMAARPDDFLALIQRTQQATGLQVTAGDVYKRPKQPDDLRLAPFFTWRGAISCTVDLEPGPALFTPELSAQVQRFFGELMPLYEYFNRFCV